MPRHAGNHSPSPKKAIEKQVQEESNSDTDDDDNDGKLRASVSTTI